MPTVTQLIDVEPIAIPILRSVDWTRVHLGLLDTGLDTVHSQVMSTIGLPLYLSKSADQYYSNALENNALYYERYGGILDAFMETLESSFGRPILFDPRLALPGFHRFSISKGFSYPGGMWHVDEFQFRILPKPVECYSATLLVGDKYESYGIEYRVGSVERYFGHRIGCITLFPSQLHHRIGTYGAAKVARCRITLQAHIWVYPRQAVAFW